MSRGASLERQLRELQGLDRPSLSARYQKLYGRPVSRSVSRDLLEAAVGYQLQKQLIAQLRHRLVQVLTAGEAIIEAAATDYNRTVLIRTWRGKVHVVTVIDETEVLYQGQSYSSLEAVARLITGDRQSAEEFFGADRPMSQATTR